MSVTDPIVTGDIALTLRWGILAGWILVSLLASVAAARLAARHHLQAADRRWSVLALAGTALFTLGLAGTQLTNQHDRAQPPVHRRVGAHHGRPTRRAGRAGVGHRPAVGAAVSERECRLCGARLHHGECPDGCDDNPDDD